MRNLQVGLFVIGILTFLAALFFAGQVMGEILWNAGVAVLLIDFGFMKLWPTSKA